MIQINLLPPEYRPRTGTPVARFVAIVVAVVLVSSASGAFAYTHFIELAKVREVRDARADEARAKNVQRERSLTLQREIDMYEKRRAAIQVINRSRVLWSRKLDQFMDIVTNQGAEDAYLVWLDTLEVPPQQAPSMRRGVARGRAKGPVPGGLFRFAAFMAMERSTDALILSSSFYEALTGNPDVTGQRTDFFRDFISINNPTIDVVERGRQEDLEPPVVAQLRYEMQLEAPDLGTPRPTTVAGKR